MDNLPTEDLAAQSLKLRKILHNNYELPRLILDALTDARIALVREADGPISAAAYRKILRVFKEIQ